MPSRAVRMCPRCLSPLTAPRCQTCERRRLDTLSLRGSAVEKPRGNPYKTPQWVAFSRAFRRAHPTCECDRCVKLIEIKRPRSQVVDHRDGLGPNGPRGFDPSNCVAMTIAHHAAKTNRHDGGLGRPINRKY